MEPFGIGLDSNSTRGKIRCVIITKFNSNFIPNLANETILKIFCIQFEIKKMKPGHERMW